MEIHPCTHPCGAYLSDCGCCRWEHTVDEMLRKGKTVEEIHDVLSAENVNGTKLHGFTAVL